MPLTPDTRALVRAAEALTHECRRIVDTLTKAVELGQAGYVLAPPPAPAADEGPRDPFGPETLAAALFPTADEEQLRADRRARLHNLLARLDRHGALEAEERQTLRMLTAVESAEADEARAQLAERVRDQPWSTAYAEDLEQARTERDQLRTALTEVLSRFTYRYTEQGRADGRHCIGVPESTFQHWHDILDGTAATEATGQPTPCRCHNGDELCFRCRRCPDVCNGCDGP